MKYKALSSFAVAGEHYEAGTIIDFDDKELITELTNIGRITADLKAPIAGADSSDAKK